MLTFITADPGHQNVDGPRGPEAKTRRIKKVNGLNKVGNPITVTNYTVKWTSNMD
jgi:hypothetical protein